MKMTHKQVVATNRLFHTISRLWNRKVYWFWDSELKMMSDLTGREGE